jgi:acyl-CoA reductase-like NAD-dependent aldehyde dehydrogenase
VFGPVLTITPVESIDEAIEHANASELGIHAGVFTSHLGRALHAARRLRFGGVLVNEVPTFRADQQPYGGVRESGNTREGPAWAIREMTEIKTISLQ